MKRKYFSIIFLILLVIARALSSEQSVKVMRNLFAEGNTNEKKAGITIVIDPGHGGRDPGKVGVNNALEKDINLAVALRLKNLLEQNDIKVIMTRTEDEGLYSESDSNKKRADLNNRIEIINSSDVLIASAYTSGTALAQEYVKAQVFYHAQSEQGRIISRNHTGAA